MRFGGANMRCLGLLQAFPPGEIALAAVAGSPMAKRAAARGLPVYSVGGHKADPRIHFRLLQLVRFGGFQVLDAQNPQSKFWSCSVARRCGVALVSTLNSWYENEHQRNLRGLLYQALERLTSNVTDMYIIVAPDIRERLLLWGLPGDALALIPNAVGFDPDAVEADHDWLCKSFNLPEDAKVCCAVGRLAEAKGHQLLVRAVAVADIPKLHCLIVGEGRLRKQLEGLITRLGLEKCVHLLGFQELGSPIVASRVGGVPQLVRHFEHALLVEPRNELSLARAISRIFERPSLAAELGRKAREHVSREFSLESQQKATQEVYYQARERAQRRLSA
jgi:glycosyltransferase involved in cell wall biosynthesis